MTWLPQCLVLCLLFVLVPPVERGIASFYWQPQMTSSGERFDPSAMTAAHRTLPLGTVVTVRHLGNGRTVRVRINDRGPYRKGRIIDLSRAAAKKIRLTETGIAMVTVRRVR